MLFEFMNLGWIFVLSKETNNMQNNITIIVLVLLSFTAVTAQETQSQDIVVKMVNLDNNKGKVFIALYNSESTFLGKEYMLITSKIENNECTITFKNVPTGTYAISLFHDENSNGIMDTNLFGIPKEDYGFSNNAKGFMGPAKWEDSKFEITNKTIHQTIKL